MMMRFKVRELAEVKGITSAAELAREARLGQSTAYALWNNERSDAAYSTLYAVGQVLGLKPDDLVEVVEGTRKIVSAQVAVLV